MRTLFSTRPLLSRVAALLLALLVVAVFVVPTQAYVLSVKRWPTPVTTYSFRSNFPNDWKSTARAADADWNQGPGYQFRFDEVSSNGKVEIYYGKFSFFPRDDDVIAYASTSDDGLWKTGVKVVVEPDRTWFKDDSYLGLVQPPAGQYSLRSVLRHELGHSLGLGHSQDSAANMFWKFNTREIRSHQSQRYGWRGISLQHAFQRRTAQGYRPCGL